MFGKKKGESIPEPPKNFVAVKDFSMEIEDGEFIVFVGPSGCGKSTTLRMIAGLEEISEGELYIGDKFMNYVMPKDRDIAMVFQNYALYPHMTAYENIAFGLKIRKIPKEKTDENGNTVFAIDAKKVKEQEVRLAKIDKLLISVENHALKEKTIVKKQNLEKQLEENEKLLAEASTDTAKSALTKKRLKLQEKIAYSQQIIDNAVNEELKKALLVKKDNTKRQLEYYKTTPQPVYNYEHLPKEVIAQKVEWAAKILGVESLLDRKPKEMSGGQRQRIALGRAMVRDPKVFLLDEPLSNLDAKLRTSMRSEIVKLHNELKTTFIYVTHDQVEAMTMGTRIVVMKDGVIQQIDTPTNLFDNPVNKFVAGFIGTPQMNFFKVKIKKDGAKLNIEFSNGGKYAVPVSEMRDIDKSYLDGQEHESILGVRGEHIVLGDDGVEANVIITEVLGSTTQVYFSVEGEENSFVACVNGRYDFRRGDNVKFMFKPVNIHLFDVETESAMTGKLK